MAGICYSIKKNRLEHGLMDGFTLSEDGTLVMNAHEAYLRCVCMRWIVPRRMDNGADCHLISSTRRI